MLQRLLLHGDAAMSNTPQSSSKERVAELRHLRNLLKTGEYMGTDIMLAWIALAEYADLLEKRTAPEPCPECLADDLHDAVMRVIDPTMPPRTEKQPEPPAPEYFDFDRAKALADAIVQKVCDSPEHTSPDDDPQLLLCYAGELENHVISALEIEFERRTGRSCCERPTATKCEGRS